MSDRTFEPDLESVIRAWLDRHELEMRGPQPGRVESYDPATQTANVRPMLRLPLPPPTHDEPVAYEDPPVIPSVPVLWPRVGTWFLSLPLQPGDYVLLVPCEGDWSEVWANGTGEPSSPPDIRRHHLAHCVALPLGLYPRRQALARVSETDMVMGSDTSGPRVQLKANGSAEIISAGATVAIKSDGTVEVSQGASVVARIDAAGNVYLGGVVGDLVALSSLVNAQFAALIATFNAHTHTVTNATPTAPGPVVAAPPMPPVIPLGSMGATKVRAT